MRTTRWRICPPWATRTYPSCSASGFGRTLQPGGERQYEMVDDSSEVIELSEPFAIKLPIAEIRP
ncbi:hypothetical protein [Micromonospora aurantiaca (nom. illeg.)]|uniref:hypothetical protein n=1 Tax=Micromonospora aurantiaca (nom. illeg.) TaxID=47850 RepID=UPI0034107244